jgi:D-beta-D-heptose 7-phosphate kinase / D-beta-D-heptose 1-phosphate adenosyltransferase
VTGVTSRTASVAMADLLRAIPGARLLCLGDVMLDRFIHGRVERVSPEAPIPVLAVEGEAEMAGGAGNVARNAAALGAGVELIGVRGRDGAGERLARLAGPGAQLVAEEGRRTTVKTRYLAAGHQLLRADEESASAVTPAAAVQLLARVDAALPRADAVVLSDYGKGVLSGSLAADAIGRAKSAGRFIAVDPRGADWSRYRGADLITPNRRELSEAAGAGLSRLEEIEAAALRLLHAHGLGAVLVTLSEQGMLLVEPGGARHIAAAAREVFDVSGAGDTVVATLALAHAAGRPLEEAMRLANAAAGIVVGKLGTATVSAEELAHALHAAGEAAANGEALLDRDAAARLVGEWRAHGLRIGFTNGCFDVLHAGHVALLSAARRRCDRLVVGLNTDESVARLKGPSRPVNPLGDRAAVLAALAAVDAVVPFAEDTPLELIRALRPDVLVKGADYTIDRVVGADIVQAAGGEVVLVELLPGRSTTSILARGGG